MNAIEFENVGKQYRLGLVSSGTIGNDLNRWWAMNILHKEDPYLKIGDVNVRSSKGDSDIVWALKNISFSFVFGHNQKFATIKLLITEINDFWMTTIMFTK